MWLARDKDGNLELWYKKPAPTWNGGWKAVDDVERMLLDENDYPEVTHDNSPVEITVWPTDYLIKELTNSQDEGYHDGWLDGRENVPEWHPYPEEEPEYYAYFVVTIQNDFGSYTTIASFGFKDGKSWIGMDGAKINEWVIAWQELPKPYEPIKGIDV